MFLVNDRFKIFHHDAEYKNMDQDRNLGQLYDVQNWIKNLHKQPGWAYSFPTTLKQIQLKILF